MSRLLKNFPKKFAQQYKLHNFELNEFEDESLNKEALNSRKSSKLA